MASESAERSLETEGGTRRKEQNEERIMDRGSTETETESEREDGKDQYSLYFES